MQKDLGHLIPVRETEVCLFGWGLAGRVNLFLYLLTKCFKLKSDFLVSLYMRSDCQIQILELRK